MSSSGRHPVNLASKFFRHRKNGEDLEDEVEVSREASVDEKDKRASVASVDSGSDSDSEHVQSGVAQVEAVTSVWSTKALVLAYAAIFLVFYVNSLQQQILSNLSPYVLSAFEQQPLVATTTVMSSIIGGVARLPVAKIIDIWGRAEGYMLMVLCLIIGLVMMAACKNAETYAAAQVFYWVGQDGISYVLDVFVADTSSLKNRPWLFAFTTCPYIANTFAGPAAAQAFYKHSTFRWGFGSFAIITPVICAPVVAILTYNKKKAVQQGAIVKKEVRRTFSESVMHYCVEFDLFGILLIVAAFALFLLPCSLALTAKNGWANPSMIAMLVVGFVLFFVFAAWERFGARTTFLPWHLLRDRTLLGGCLLGAINFISFYCWDGYFTSYLQAVHNLSLSDAGYVYNTYNIGSSFFAVILGFIIRATGSFKYMALAAIPFQILGTGLMVYFRTPGHGIGLVVMCQIFISFSGGALVISEQMAVMAAAKHQEVAVVLALLSLFTSLGNAVGQTIAGAIYTGHMPAALAAHLPAESKGLATTLYGSLTTQLTYPVGSPVRDAIIAAYGDTQRLLTIAGTAVLPLGIVFILMMKNIDVRKTKQVKGNVV